VVRLRYPGYIALTALVGCAVGHDFQQPKARDVTSFTSTPLSAETANAPVTLRSQVDLQRYLLTGADIALTANVVTAAVKDASLRATIRATREIAEAEEQQLDIVEKQFKVGAVAITDVLAQRTQLAQTRALIPPLERGAAQNRHLLAVLAGKLPSEASSLPEFSLEGFALPADLPVSRPSSLVKQRPDILASESVLHTASAQIGVATANLYPQITLTGGYGSEAIRSSGLFKSGSSVWNLGAGLVRIAIGTLFTLFVVPSMYLMLAAEHVKEARSEEGAAGSGGNEGREEHGKKISGKEQDRCISPGPGGECVRVDS